MLDSKKVDIELHENQDYGKSPKHTENHEYLPLKIDNDKNDKISNKNSSTTKVSENINSNIKKDNQNKKTSHFRKIFINNSSKNKHKYNYIDNYVRSSKYTFIDFLPKSLLFQFKRYANIYFLFIMIIQCVPDISPLNPITGIFPFLFVLSISIIREGIEDISRHKQDEFENSQKVYKYSNSKVKLFSEEKSKNLRIGDIVKLVKNDTIPADLLILACSNLSKTAYIETSNLDGEKNLKPILCLLKPFNLMKNMIDENICRLRGKIICIKPTADLNIFSGDLIIGPKKNECKYHLSKSQLLFKGTSLKDTDWAIGVVIYTGAESKIILNINKSRGKTSHLEMTINRLMILIFCIQVTLCILCAVGSSYFQYYHFSIQKYIIFPDIYNTSIAGITSFFSYLLLFNTMIPISLVVSLEMVKYGQAYFMSWDVQMYSDLRKQFVTVNSCSLNEEMGQIKYIFSDKTGTLTTNKLVFKKAFIWDTEFGKLAEEIEESSNKNNSKLIVPDFPYGEIKDYYVYGKEGKTSNLEIFSGNKIDSLKFSSIKDFIFQYILSLALNQCCFINKTKKNQTNLFKRLSTVKNEKKTENGKFNFTRTATIVSEDFHMENYEINYTGESPDDIVLTKSMKDTGVVYFEGDENKRVLRILKGTKGYETYSKEEFQILKVMEFNSTRGMSSIIVKKDGKIFLYSKGGDGKIGKRLSVENNGNKDKIFDKVKYCSEKGYRVLCVSMKILDEKEFKKWNNELTNGLEKLDENQKENFQNFKYEEIEKDQILLGCSVVEDKLQDLVPDTIKELQSAGVNIWVLTGDNLETARNIGVMCNLLPEKMIKYFLYGDSKKMEKNLLDNFNLDINEDSNIFKETEKIIEDFENIHHNIYVVPENKQTEIYKEYQTQKKLKILLHIFLHNIKEKTKLENTKPEFTGILRGLIIEMVCLTCILPPPIKKFSNELYNHPLTQLFLDVSLTTQAVVCCR